MVLFRDDLISQSISERGNTQGNETNELKSTPSWNVVGFRRTWNVTVWRKEQRLNVFLGREKRNTR